MSHRNGAVRQLEQPLLTRSLASLDNGGPTFERRCPLFRGFLQLYLQVRTTGRAVLDRRF